MIRKIVDFLSEYLRINAIRRMLTYVDIKKSELFGLLAFAVLYAAFEGVGLSMLLPILQFAENGQTAISASSGSVWGIIARFMEALSLPMTLPVLLVMAFIPILLRQVVFYFNTWYSAWVSGHVAVRMRMQTLARVLDADSEFFDRHQLGQIVGVVINQSAAAGAAILAVMRQLTVALLIVLYMAILLAISVPLTVITAISALVVSAAIKVNITRIRDFGLKAARVNQNMMAKIVERFSMMRLIKLRDQKHNEYKRIESYSEEMREIGVKQARLGANIEVTADPLLMLAVFITLYIGITALNMTLAQLGLVMFVLTRLNAKIKEFNGGRQAISANVSGLTLVREMTEDAMASNNIRRGPQEFAGLKDELVFDQVSFAYPAPEPKEGEAKAEDKLVLKDISFTIPAGSFVAFVGRSGAGKSTLVELIPRLREATEGSITFDGTDVKQFDVGTLRKGIGYLTQSAMLFNESVLDNLRYGLSFEPTDEQVRDALEQAYASFVYDLPDGLDTKLGDRGVRFSGGERQRIGLARVMLENDSILILDEPTSALDSESEAYIQKALARLHGKKTIIVIAHRLATVIQADQLFVIDDGRVVERGRHDELIAADGAYKRLFESQLLQ